MLAPIPASFWRDFREVARLSLPLAAVQLGYQLMGFVDTAIAGRMGELPLAATGLGASIFFGVSIVGIGVVMGLDPLAAQAFGSGQPRLARRILWQGVWAAVIVALPLSGVMLLVAQILSHFGVVPELATLARGYILARLPALLPMFSAIAVRSYLQSAHATRAVLISTIAANLFNFAAGWALGFGDAGLVRLGLPAVGLPALGVTGLGLAAFVSSLGQVVFMALAAERVPPGEGTEPLRRFDTALVKKLMRFGTPIGLMLLAEVGVFTLAQVLIGCMGVIATAAHQVALIFASASFSVCLGIGAATSVQVGRAIGRGDALATRRSGIAGIALGASFMCGAGLVFVLAPAWLVPIIASDTNAGPLAITLLQIAAVFQLADGIQAVSSGALRGAGVTTFAFLANVLAHWGIGLPIGLWLAYSRGMGAVGIWWGLTVGLMVIAVLLAGKFVHATRKQIQRVV